MVAQFAHHHPQFYRRALIATLAVMLFGGLHSAVVAQAKRISFVPSVQPPVSAMAATAPQQPVRPRGWEQATQLPGRSGSGDAANAQRTAQQTAQTARPPIAVVIPTGSANAMAIGRDMNAAMFGDAHWPALQALWTKESGWNPSARNRSSGACGIPQALPCSKIPDMSTQGQIQWGLDYIKQRYGNPTNAYRFWMARHWY